MRENKRRRLFMRGPELGKPAGSPGGKRGVQLPAYAHHRTLPKIKSSPQASLDT